MSDQNTMSAQEFAEAIRNLDLTFEQMADMIGYSGPHRRGQVDKMAKGRGKITPQVARLVRAYLAGHRPADWPSR